MNYLFLIDRVHLRPGATPICALDLARSLVESGDQVHVLTLGLGKFDCVEDGIFIHSIANIPYMVFYGESSSSLIKNAFMLLGKFCYYVLSTLHLYDFAMLYNNSKTVDAALELVEKYGIDTVVSFSEPFGTQLVGNKVKAAYGNSIKWIAYEMDPFALNYNRPKSKERTNRALETSILGIADLIIMVNGINEENVKRGHLIDQQEKIITIPLPGFRFDQESYGNECQLSKNRSKNYLTLVYTGIFYSKFRTPIALCRLLSEVNFDYELHLYGAIDQSDFVDFPDILKHCIFYGYRSKEECDEACRNADILVDIQNDIPNQIPSKLLSYMSYGKKILSLYSDINTLGISYLDGYPNALCVKKDMVKDSRIIDEVNAFCMAPEILVELDSLYDCLRPYEHSAVVADFENAVKRIGA